MPSVPAVAVAVLADCPHTPQVALTAHQVIDCNTPCASCANEGENWICATCGVTLCGRHVNGHMLLHREETRHPIACGILDLSFWCYECEEYLAPTNPRLRPYYNALCISKFGEGPPN